MQIERWFTYFIEDSPIEMPERQACDVYVIQTYHKKSNIGNKIIITYVGS